MLAIVRRARRRLIFNQLLRQAANAANAALVVFILLLLLGTQILNWQWVVSIPCAGLLFGLYRVWRRTPGTYQVAQLVDGRLGLADTLSTAWFFSHNEAPHTSAEMRRLQSERASQMAKTVDVPRAVPYIMPRSVYTMAGLILVASSLFALRYGLTRRLDLRPPMAHMLQQMLGLNPPPEQARNNQPRNPDPLFHEDDSSTPQDADAPGGNRDSDASGQEESADGQADQGQQKQGTAESKKQGENGEQAEGDQQESSGDERSGEENSRPGEGQQQGMAKSDPKQNNRQDGNNSADNSSLVNKLKDAMQNLFSRAKPQNQQGTQQSAADRNNPGRQQQNNGKPQAGKDGQQSGGQQSESQEGQAGEQAQNSQEAEGKGTGKSDAQQANKQPGSGIGSHDGDKNIKQAADLAAMGKITELFGKRSATITGEATVEVQSTSQQLRTPYAQRGGQHQQSGTEIRRDEVHVALQTYVEHYLEEIRKQAPVKSVATRK